MGLPWGSRPRAGFTIFASRFEYPARKRPIDPGLLNCAPESAIAGFMTLVAAAGSKLAPFERLADGLVDSKRRGRTVLCVLAGYDALWTVYGVLAKGSQDINFDMGEVVAWSRELALGFPKHPPLCAWV